MNCIVFGILGIYVFMGIYFLLQRQTVLIDFCVSGLKLSCLPKSLPLEEGEDGRVEKTLISLEARRVGTLLITWFYH